jgi:hypothetical protein
LAINQTAGIIQNIGQGGVNNLQDTAKAVLPKILGAGSLFVNVIAWIIIFIVLVVIACVILFVYFQKRRYNNILIIFERINNVWVDTFLDKGTEVKFSPLGTSVMYFKKLKRYEPMPKIQSGSRKFYFKKYADGTLINFRLDDTNNESFEKFTDMNKAMLYHHTGINRGLQNRFDKAPMWKEYLPLIISVGFIMVIVIGTYFLFDKWIALAETTNAGVKVSGEILEKANAMLGAMDNVCSNGKGFVQGVG